MIKVRATPLLKAMGFKYDKALRLYNKDLTYWARVYLLNQGLRALEIWKDLWKSNGDFGGRTLLLKNFPLNCQSNCIPFYWDIFTRLAVKSESPDLLNKFFYYLGINENNSDIEEKLYGSKDSICFLPKIDWSRNGIFDDTCTTKIRA